MIEFPIKKIIIENGEKRTRVLNNGDKVRCWYCNQPITINNSSIYPSKTGTELVRCPYIGCNRKVSVLYYFDRVIPVPQKPKKKRRKKYKEYTYNRLTETNRTYKGEPRGDAI